MLTRFGCWPVFLDPGLKDRYYTRFCKQQLWPLLHCMIPQFEEDLWSSYMQANTAFAARVIELLGGDDLVWIHDYHLMALPFTLHKRSIYVKCGFFLHCPFPSPEIFRTCPWRDHIARSLLLSDVLGFHIYEYAHNFLHFCRLAYKTTYSSKRGVIVLAYQGREICVKIMPTGVDPPRLAALQALPDAKARRAALELEHSRVLVLLGMDDLDQFKGIDLKLRGFELMLRELPHWQGLVQLVQVCIPPKSLSPAGQDLRQRCLKLVQRINDAFGTDSYVPVLWLERLEGVHDRAALLALADVVVVTATRDGMNLLPYEYVVARQAAGASLRRGSLGLGLGGVGLPSTDFAAHYGAAAAMAASSRADSLAVEAAGGSGSPAAPLQSPQSLLESPHSTLVVSEFVGCSPSLSGAIRCNPHARRAVSDAMNEALSLSPRERALRHDKHWKYVKAHTVQYWVQSFVADLREAATHNTGLQYYETGLSPDTYNLVALTSQFRRLGEDLVQKAYRKTARRLILLDYDGTLIASSDPQVPPSERVLGVLTALAADPANAVYVVSGRARRDLEAWFDAVPGLGLAAEHGFYWRAPSGGGWETQDPGARFDWKDLVMSILRNYVERTDGSVIEAKDSALVWHYARINPGFAGIQAKELLNHLASVLANQPLEVVSGDAIVEVKPPGVSKGRFLQRLVDDQRSKGDTFDFVFCVGDDKSDEDMFVAAEGLLLSMPGAADVFACTVGQKPSRAPFYLDDPHDVVGLLEDLVRAGRPGAGAGEPMRVTFA